MNSTIDRLSDTSPLTKEQTIQLFKEMHDGSKSAREMLIEHNLSLVWSIVYKFKRPPSEQHDLFQVGCIGLIKSIDKFDESRNVYFSTYAYPYIMGFITKHLRTFNTIYAPIPLLEKAYLILKKDLKDAPMSVIQKETGMDVNTIRSTLSFIHKSKAMSLDEAMYNKANDNDKLTVEDMVSSDVNGNEWFERMVLHDAIKRLDVFSQKIIKERFFLGKTQKELGEEIGFSRSYVAHLEKKALHQLKYLYEHGKTNMNKSSDGQRVIMNA